MSLKYFLFLKHLIIHSFYFGYSFFSQNYYKNFDNAFFAFWGGICFYTTLRLFRIVILIIKI